MNKLPFLILLILFSCLDINAQGKFSADKQEFKEQYLTFLEDLDKKMGPVLADTSMVLFNQLDDEAWKHTVRILNRMYRVKIESLDAYSSFYEGLLHFKQEYKDSPSLHISYLASIDKYVNAKRRREVQHLIRSSKTAMVDSLLTPNDKTIKWYYEGGKLVYEPDEKLLFQLCDVKMVGVKGRDSVFIDHVSGHFIPQDSKVMIQEAKVYWDRRGMAKDSLYATLGACEIDLGDHRFVAENVELTNTYLFQNKVMGKLVNGAEPSTAKSPVYPHFISYKSDYQLMNEKHHYEITSGFGVKGGRFLGIGDKNNRAEIVFYRKDAPVIKLNSKQFFLSKDQISSNDAGINIYVGTDSIYHQKMAFLYKLDERIVRAGRTNDRISKSAMTNTLQRMDMFINSVFWHVDSTEVYFLNDKYQELALMSGRYFEQEIFDRFKGLNSVNPLDKLYGITSMYDDGQPIPIDEIQAEMEIPKKYVVHLLMDLASLGYAYVELDLDRARFNQKFRHLVESEHKEIDYDVITFHSQKDSNVKSVLDLDSLTLKTSNLGFANISEKNRVKFYPDTGEMQFTENLDFKFDGKINLGTFNFLGDQYSFVYDDYIVKMDGLQKMNFSVPAIKPRSDGKYYLERVKTPVDSLRGALLIDEPDNKSGVIDAVEYPILESSRETYVFYDRPEIEDSVYAREQMYVRLYPFTLDSLNLLNGRKLDFPGTLFSNGIFPEFDETVKVQDDYSLGFEHETGEGGYPLYNKGQYYQKINLNMKGLTGEGNFTYLNADVLSSDIHFYPDSLAARASDFEIKGQEDVDYNIPDVVADTAYVLWQTRRDSLFATAVPNNPFRMYNNYMQYEGTILMTPQALMGSGQGVYPSGKVLSEAFTFTSTEVISDSMKVWIRDNSDAEFDMEMPIVSGRINIPESRGELTVMDEMDYVYFPKNHYMAWVQDINWQMEDKQMEMSRGDGEAFLMQSTLASQDSLKFTAGKIRYSQITDEIEAYEVDSLEIADALIYPDSARVTILNDGQMGGLMNARMYVNKYNKKHYLDQAQLIVDSQNKYSGSAVYQYTDVDGLQHPVLFNDIYVDSTTLATRAVGQIKADEGFMLNPYFSFFGETELTGEHDNLTFRGYVGITNYCNNIETGSIPINMFVDPGKVEIEPGIIDQAVGNSQFMFNGIYVQDSIFTAAFMSQDSTLVNKRFIGAQGKVYYDEAVGAYTVRRDPNDTQSEEILYFNDECRMEARGRINFNDPEKTLGMNVFGDLSFDLNNKNFEVKDLAMGLNFHFNSKLLDIIHGDVELSTTTKEVTMENKALKLALDELAPGKKLDDDSGLLRGVPSEMKHTLFLNNVPLKWHKELGFFESENEIGLAMVDGKLVNKTLKGKLEIKKGRSMDEITLYFVCDNDNYYYFRYRDNVMDFYSNNTEAMEAFDLIDEEDREVEVNGVKFKFKKASRLKVRTFQRIYF